jgi:hypothetical protein
MVGLSNVTQYYYFMVVPSQFLPDQISAGPVMILMLEVITSSILTLFSDHEGKGYLVINLLLSEELLLEPMPETEHNINKEQNKVLCCEMLNAKNMKSFKIQIVCKVHICLL